MKPAHPVPHQRGAASLLVALVLMVSTTLITLSVAHTHSTETRMAANERSHKRLVLASESAWEHALGILIRDRAQLRWTPATDGSELISYLAPTTRDGIETRAGYRRMNSSPFVQVQATSTAGGNLHGAGHVSQTVRLLTVLSPLAESAPPLVINGCLHAATTNIAIHPIDSDTKAAGDALWRYTATPCPTLGAADLHGGHSVLKQLEDPLWETFFTVSQEAFARLAASEQALPEAQRRYWLAEPALAGRIAWQRSLGSVETPVVLHFPAAAGCPRFAAGVHIVGFVFIDSACPEPLANTRLDITGSLVINGNASSGNASVRLRHIQTADRLQNRLSLPVIRAVKVPGSWRDF